MWQPALPGLYGAAGSATIAPCRPNRWADFLGSHYSLGGGEPGREALWWALALGADFGGNATLNGASANIIVANLAAKGGQPITFRAFLAYGVPVTLGSALIATAWVWLRYLL